MIASIKINLLKPLNKLAVRLRRIFCYSCNYDPAVAVPAVKYENPKVSGQNRYKYFRRPIIPFLQQVPPEVLLQPTT